MEKGHIPEEDYSTKASEGDTSNAQPPPYEAGAYGSGYGTNQAYGFTGNQYGPQHNYTYGTQDPAKPISQQPVMGGTVIVGAMPAEGYVIQPVIDMPRPPSYLVLSCIVFWLVNLCFGAVAMGFSFSSQSAADRGEMLVAQKHGEAAKKLSIAGAVFTIAFITTFLIVYFVAL